ncbi:MAG: hypothetical protein HKN47_12990 [Pirellulaceae bacterium]|nr:hypothetical protein [Pirellulaceae bacterium]
MAASNRAQLITKLHTVLKKKYQAPPTQPTRPMLEHLLYACVLEDCPADLADGGFAKLEQDFFDWNEVRVTTVTELSHVLSRLPDPVKAARRLKENLQAVFEEFYTFELDHLKKENLGKAVNKFEKMPAMTPFVLGYTVQHGLGGHSIPVDFSAMMMMLATEIATQAEAKSGRVPGLERAIPKNKGIEFATLLHIAAVGLSGDLKDKKARETMDAVNKGSSQRLDDWIASKKAAKRRGVKRKAEAKAKAEADAKAAAEAARLAKIAAAEKAAKKAASKAAAKKKSTTRPEPVKSVSASTSKTAKSKSTKKVAVTAKKAAKKPAKKAAAASKKKPVKKSTAKKPTSKKSTSKKPATKKPTAKKSAAKKATATKSKSASKKASKKTAAKKSPAKKKPTKKKGVKKAASKKSSSRKLTKRKPR